VFSNAALHWLPDHEHLLPRLLGWLAPDGILAVQLPRNHALPSHRLVAEVLDAGSLGTPALRERLRRIPVDEPGRYFEWCAPHARVVDVWETTYVHALEGEDPVLRWLWGTTLRPVLDALDAGEIERLRARLAIALKGAYPPRQDGRTLFPFRRVFVVARR
jgi:trans-aconitate 2-methyltransferase